MFRDSLFVIAVLGSAATALAAIAPGTSTNARNMTVIAKNQTWHVVDNLTVQPCHVEDCSDTPQT